jgi:hypothetical protein
MARQQKRAGRSSGKGSRSPRRNNFGKRAVSNLPPRPPAAKSSRAQQERRNREFELIRLRKEGYSWHTAEAESGARRQTAERDFPSAFYRDRHGRLQVHGHDRYTRTVNLPTSEPGELRIVRARGDRQASLCGQWLNALKVAGRGDFSLIDAFPPGTIVGGVHLVTDHEQIQQILSATAESDKPFEQLYAMAGGK